ncbi:hypothetical protein QTP70_007059 [Hemibagrus guttatus]|uniref:Endonuclease/exonuclease/phosphatase domain-containing protein n=1 Tax=Hemibagrus guttatus TaxID=175788 RepID=A0AAE0VFR4_9TELE|nr:hypothetical protein QTP70_007059 [Hemibagrus guttatus]
MALGFLCGMEDVLASGSQLIWTVAEQMLRRCYSDGLLPCRRLIQSWWQIGDVYQPFRGGLAGVFWIIVLLQNPSSLQLEVTNLPIYQSGKGYKAISKALGLPRTTVRAIIYKWRKHGTVENLHRSGRPTKIIPRAQRQLIQEVTKDPTTTSKELQASLASVKENVRPSVCDLKLKRTWVLQQDNDPKHTSKSTSEWLKKNKMKTLEWPRKGRELADMMERRKVDILCGQETRWKGTKARSIGAGFKLFYYGVDSKRNGVGVVLKEEFVRNVLEVKRVSDRVMSLKLEIEGVMLNVVSGYAPQVGCELEEKERFWSELDEVMESIPTGERVVIGADFNGHG